MILLPCPWCGRKINLAPVDGSTEQYIQCRNCKASGPLQHGRSHLHPGPFDSKRKDMPYGVDLAEEAWNRRYGERPEECPFCATDDLPETFKLTEDCYFCSCKFCGANGPNAPTRVGALVKWKREERS